MPPRRGGVRHRDSRLRHETAREIFDASRARLEAAMTVAGLPKFTVSFGVVGADPKDDLPTTISRADAALFQAKREGRDRVIVLDALGQRSRSRPEPRSRRATATAGCSTGGRLSADSDVLSS